mgnify:CR=1 FL=1
MAVELPTLKAIDELLGDFEDFERTPLSTYAERIRTLAVLYKHTLAEHYRRTLDPKDELEARAVVDSSIGKFTYFMDHVIEECESDDDNFDDHESGDALVEAPCVLPDLKSSPSLKPATEPAELGYTDEQQGENEVDDITASGTASATVSLHTPRDGELQTQQLPNRRGKWHSTKEDLKVRIKTESDSGNESDSLSLEGEVFPSEHSATATVRADSGPDNTDADTLDAQIERDWNANNELGDIVLASTVQIGDRTVQIINEEYDTEPGKETGEL